MTTTLPSSPNPFLDSQVGSRAPLPGRFSPSPALIVFLLCLVVGLAAVGWRAKRRADDARTRASADAMTRCAAVEMQFSQVLSAAEVLGVLARQYGGTIPNFQKVAAELMASRPGLASLELQPGGVVREIAPRAGNDRAVGINLLNNPVYGPSANAAIQKRSLTVVGPLPLYGGEPGIVARVPIFQRARDGRETFWGFVAASMQVSDALRRAQVNDLAKQGYSYVLFAPASANRKAVTLGLRGVVTAQEAVQQPVRTRDLEFRLALQPRSGWISKTRVVLEGLGVLALSGLLCLMVNLLGSRESMETALAEVNQRLGRETERRKQAQEDCRGAKDQAAAARAELDEARSTLQSNTEQVNRLNAVVRAAEETAQARQAESDQARTALQQAEQTVSELQASLETAARGETKSAAALRTRLEAAQATIADLELRLEGATRLALEAADVSATKAGQTGETRQDPGATPGEGEGVASSRPPADEAILTPVTTPEPEASAPATPEALPAEPTPPPSQPAAEKKPPRVARRKKTRHDNQMDLFAPQLAADQSPEVPAADAEDVESGAEATSVPMVEPEQQDKPVVEATGQAPTAPETAPEPKEEKPARPLPASPPVNPAQLRKAVNLIMPLFTGQDPGARDCLKDNRSTFRSAFSPEAYVEFEQSVKRGDFNAALEQLKKAAKRHGVSA